MNFLAHIYLSGDDDEIMIGNFIADFVKGKKKDDFPDRIRKGIELHRAIDDFTDHHSITAKSKSRLYSVQHKYAAVVVDLFYDHFLAKNFSNYSKVELKTFAAGKYQTIESFHYLLPDRVKDFLPYMISRNWLLNYESIEGIGRTLSGLSQRVAFENKMDQATLDLRNHYSAFEEEFSAFFPELITFVSSWK